MARKVAGRAVAAGISEVNPGEVDPSEVDPSDELVADVFSSACSSRRTLENIAGKWAILALVALRDGTIRFNALRRRVDGVSEKMLAQTLHALERDGLIIREVRSTIPPHVSYRLTALGIDVSDRLRGVIELVEARMPDVLAAQERYERGA